MAATYIRKVCKYNAMDCSVSIVLVKFLCTCNVCLIFVYPPPSYDLAQKNSLICFICEFCTNREVVVLGVFNLATLKCNADDTFFNYATLNDMSFVSTFASVGLTQIIKEGTFFPTGNVLDLCLVLHLGRVEVTRVLPPLPGSHHCHIILEYVLNTLCSHK